MNRPVALLMGPETRGLPEHVRLMFPQEQWIRLPMAENSRSLNLSNATAVIVTKHGVSKALKFRLVL